MAEHLSRIWRAYIIFVLLFIASIFTAFYPTVTSIVSIWERSGTFAHGYIIVPIVLWLVWGKRKSLALSKPGPDYRYALLLIPLVISWLLAELADVLVISQFAFVALLVVGIALILGPAVTRLIAFPLVYLFFAVPVGEGLVPVMMEYTATFTVWAVQASGIPVYRDGLFFFLPSGNWSVVEACSGVRYLIASAALGCLFAYLTYRSFRKRLLFVLASLIVPILANGLRAYTIVMIGHFSNMKLAVGVDHLIYGWVFFGAVMLVLFSLGSIWADPVTETEPVDTESANFYQNTTGKMTVRRGLVALLLAVLLSVVGPLTSGHLESIPAGMSELQVMKFEPPSRIVSEREPAWDWRPVSEGADVALLGHYGLNDQPVGLYVTHYLYQMQGREVISPGNMLLRPGEKDWRVKRGKKLEIVLGDENVHIREIVVSDGIQDLLVWYWYRIGETNTSNPYIGKIMGLYNRLFTQRQDASRIMVVTPLLEQREDSRKQLQSFVDEIFITLVADLDATASTRDFYQ